MRLWEELSGIIFKGLASPYLKEFRGKSPERILRKSIEIIDPDVLQTLREYIRNCQDQSGGFNDRAGNPDIYYTLFGYFLADALDLRDLFPAIKKYTEKQLRNKDINGIHLHCASILYARLGDEKAVMNSLSRQLRQQIKTGADKQPAYRAFIGLLACYYLNDFRGLYLIKDQLDKLNESNQLPSPVVAAMLVLQHSFGKDSKELKENILSFLSEEGGFKAVRAAPVADLLSTAVSLYALRFAGHDMRLIKPECLNFIDLLYRGGGFSANLIDPDPDIEYTFYGFLALGALAE